MRPAGLHRQSVRVGLYLWVALLLSACGHGALGVRLPEQALLGLPPEGQRWVFDAENAVVVALDGVDIAQEDLRAASAAVERAQRSLEIARKHEREKGTDLGVRAARERLRGAELAQDLARQRVEVARAKVRQARAGLELDKARLVVTYDLVAVRGFQLAPFLSQSQEATQKVEAEQQRAESLSRKLQEQEEQARKAREEYIARTGDYDSGVWLD